MAKTMDERVPLEFSKGPKHPRVFTVQELMNQLQRLPPELPLGLSDDEGFELIVANVKRENPHLCFEECREGDDEEFDD